MRELDRARFYKMRGLARALNIHLAVDALFGGVVPGAVYVDNPQAPQIMLAWTGHRVYLAGTSEVCTDREEVGRLLASTILPGLRRAGARAFTLYYAPDAWQTVVEQMPVSNPPMRAERQFYRCLGSKSDWRSILPDGYVLRAVDKALLSETKLRYLDALRVEMCSERPSVEAFLETSFGVCALLQDAIAGWCLSEYNRDERCEVGIETLEGHRQRGLATAMAKALVEKAFERGLSQVGWHCWQGNEASVATARKVGFEHVVNYPALLVRLD